MKTSALVWALSFSVLGTHPPPGGELAKFNTKQECMQALEQKREEFKDKKLKIVGNCYLTNKQQ